MPISWSRNSVVSISIATIIFVITGWADAGPGVEENVSYACDNDSTGKQQLDLYRPIGKAPAPILLFIHGGGWYGGDKSRSRATGVGFSQKHVLVAVMNYRLAPAFRHPAAVQDAARAVAWLHENGARYGGDPERIYVAGHSTGGHTAALLGTDPKYLKAEGLDLSALKGVILLDGAGYDLLDSYDTGNDRVKDSINAIFGRSRDAIKDASPIEHIRSDAGIPPFLIFFANGKDHDQDIAKRENADRIADPLRKAGVCAQVESADMMHGLIEVYFGVAGNKITAVTNDFLSKGTCGR